MRLLIYLLWIILIALGASFAALNSQYLSIDYFIGKTNIYFPLLLLVLLFTGVLLGMLAMAPTVIKLKSKAYKSPKKNS